MKKGNAAARKKKAATAIAIVMAIMMVMSVIAPFLSAIVYGASEVTETVAPQKIKAELSADANGPSSITEEDPLAKIAKEIKNGTITIDANLGFDGKFLSGNQTPMVINLKNIGTDFNGTVRIKTYTGTQNDNESFIYNTYSKKIILPAGSSKKIVMEIVPDSITGYVTICLVDEKEKTIASKNVTAASLGMDSVLVGILSDERADGLGYLQNADFSIKPIDYMGAGGTTANLTLENLPMSMDAMKNFSAIIIDDFDTSLLNKSQIDALIGFVDSGGMLILGTGLNAEKVLGGFHGVFDFQINGSGEITNFTTLDSMAGYDIEGSLGPITMPVAKLSVKGSKAIASENGQPITLSLKHGQGNIIIHTFSLGTAPFSESPNMIEVLKKMYQSESYSAFDIMSRENGFINNNMNRNGITRVPAMEKSQIMVLWIIIISYIVLIGPVLYIILKRKDKREKGWIIIPVGALIFTVVIYGISFTSEYKKSILNFVSYIDLDMKNPVAETTLCVKSPDKGKVTLAIDKPLSVSLGDSNSNNYYSRYGNKKSSSGWNSDVTYDDKETVVTFPDNSSWDENVIYTSIKDNVSGEIKGKFNLTANGIEGTLENNTGIDLEDVILGFGQNFIRYERLPNGEKIDIKIRPVPENDEIDYVFNQYEAVNKLFLGDTGTEIYDSVKRGDITSAEAFSKEQRINFFRNSTERLMEETGDMKITLTAFSSQTILDGTKFVNKKKAIENCESIYYKTFDINLKGMNVLELPFGMIAPKDIRFDGENYRSMADKNGRSYYLKVDAKMEAAFQVPKSFKLDMFEINWDSYDSVKGDMYIYNSKENVWEVLNTKAPYKENVDDYVNGNGEIRVSADMTGEMNINEPEIYMKGGSK